MTPPDFSNPLIDEPPAFPGLTELKACAISEPLTKRERFAMAAMQGLMAFVNSDSNFHAISHDAIRQADSLIAALKSIPEPQ